MTLRIYRVALKDGNSFNFLKKSRLGKTAIAFADRATAALPPPVVKVADDAISGGVALYKRATSKPSSIIDITSTSELNNYSAYDDFSFSDTAFYAEHPKKNHVLIPTARFYDVILEEQIADLTAYFRSKLRVTRLNIEVRAHRDASVGGKASKHGVSAGAGINMHHLHLSEMKMSYSNPELVPLKAELVWMNDFKKIRNAVESATGGTALFKEVHDFSLGIKAELAEKVGISADWLSTRTFIVDVEFE